MIKLEHVVLASPEQMDFIIEGMRNPLNSWKKSDSGIGCDINLCTECGFKPQWCGYTDGHVLGPNDHSLMQRLANAGTDHRKFMRMMPVYVRITAPLYFYKELDTYKVGTVANSCSTMHKIHEKEFTLEDFSCDHLLPAAVLGLQAMLDFMNTCREAYLETKDKKYWWQMIQLLPSSYNQTRNVMLNYEVLANIYKSRKNHKLDEWCELCKWIETLPYSELICGSKPLNKAVMDKINDIGLVNPICPEEIRKILNKE